MALGAIRGTVRDQYGRPVDGVTIQVVIHGGSNATIYSDRSSSALANPMTCESDGSFLFYALTTQTYDLVFTKTGLTFDNTDFTDMAVDTGGTGAIATAHLADAAVTTAKIADSNVTNAKLSTDAVTQGKIADAAVGTAELIDANVTAAKLASDSVTTVKILDANVTTAKIADSNITTAKIADSSVTTAKIADGNVTYAKLESGLLSSLLVDITVSVVVDDLLFGENPSSATGVRFGSFGWCDPATSFSGTELRLIDSEASHPGILRMSVADIISPGSSAIGGTDRNTRMSILPASFFDITFCVRIPTSVSGRDIEVGLIDLSGYPGVSGYAGGALTSTSIDDGIYFQRLNTDTNWFGVTRKNGTQTRVDTGIAASTSFIRLRVRRVDASTIGFTAGGGSEQTSTSNIPTIIQNVFFAPLDSNDYDLDFCSIAITGLSR